MENLTERIQSEASQCVKCGLCLPHCPTYQLTQHEGESPRGRIALFEGLATKKLPLTSSVLNYTDHCLACGACERVCPANVAYGKLLVHGRTLIRQKKPLSFFKRLLHFFVLHIPHFLDSQANADIALSPGCIHSWFDRKTLKDSIRLLNHFGYKVCIPKHFRCCGALHAHDGQAKLAQKIKQKNTDIFKQLAVKTILSTATGCTPTLQTQSDKVSDILTFLYTHDWPKHIQLQSLPQRVLVHTPCTLKNVLQQAQIPLQLLQKIPDLTVVPLKNPHCCGAAGSYFLSHQTMAENLAESIIQEIKSIKPDLFVTSNIGCAIHLKRQLKKHKIKLKICHPISILCEQLRP